MLIVLAILAEEPINNNVTCFKASQELIGHQSTQTLELVVEPKSDLSDICKSFSVGSANAQLIFQGLSITPTSNSIRANMMLPKLVFTFTIPSLEDFKAILNSREAMYTIKFLESLIVEGTI